MRFYCAIVFILIIFSSCGSSNKVDIRRDTSKVNSEKLPVILFIGDSLTAGYGVDSNECFVGLFAKKFKDEKLGAEIKNAGITGETSAGTLARIDFLLQSKPTLIFLCTGSNDGLRGQSAEQYQKNLNTIIQKIQDAKVALVLAGVRIPINLGFEYSQKISAVPEQLAKQYNLPYYPFLLEGVALDPALNNEDSLHPNEKGHFVIFKNLDEFFKKIELYKPFQINKE